MPGTRRGLVAPQNTFLENIIRRSNGQRKCTLSPFQNLSLIGTKGNETLQSCLNGKQQRSGAIMVFANVASVSGLCYVRFRSLCVGCRSQHLLSAGL